jgi:hypothetical protein
MHHRFHLATVVPGTRCDRLTRVEFHLSSRTPSGMRDADKVADASGQLATFAGIACRSYANVCELPSNGKLASALPGIVRKWLNCLL